MNIFTQKLGEVTKSVLPIIIIVLISNFFIPEIQPYLIKFLISSVFLIIGFTFFLVGVEIGISPLGKRLGDFFSKYKKKAVIIILSFILGFVISLAEPSLLVLANRIEFMSGGIITSLFILVVVSLGIGISMIIGIFRTYLNIPLFIILIIMYLIIFLISLFVNNEIIAIAFDASGATTGVITVPFILSLSLGMAANKRDSKMGEKDSFGLIAITSAGAIIAFLVIGLFKTFEFTNTLKQPMQNANFSKILNISISDSILGILPITIIFILLNLVFLKIEKKLLRKISFGLCYSLIGLFLFLLGVNYGFMPIATLIGKNVADYNIIVLLFIAFIFGFTTIMAEPAIHVLTSRIEEVTAGYIKRKTVLISIAIGTGLAIVLAVLKLIVPELQLTTILFIGYLIAILLTLVAPKLFVGIAFDAGGVATGPMTATFIFAFVEGIATNTSSTLISTLGMISLVALSPIITLQILGLMFSIKSKKSGGALNG